MQMATYNSVDTIVSIVNLQFKNSYSVASIHVEVLLLLFLISSSKQ